VDVSEEMLEVGRDKCGRNQLYVEFEKADVLALPFPDGAGRDDLARDGAGDVAPGHAGAPGSAGAARPAGFDACTVGFGIRNVPDIVGAFSEMRRVCRPGGRVVCLEITRPTIPVFKEFYALWFRRIVPVLGRLAARDATAYTYLPASVLRFPGPEELKHSMEQAGLHNVRYEILAGGIIALHHAIVC
jgi:ubiquinone/menaquinone biosynthesis C-methylase UbiE